jgi:hypothetical protein
MGSNVVSLPSTGGDTGSGLTASAVTYLSNTLEEIIKRLKIVQSDVDSVKKNNRYWEDRNLLQQSVDEKVGRNDFRSKRQGR